MKSWLDKKLHYMYLYIFKSREITLTEIKQDRFLDRPYLIYVGYGAFLMLIEIVFLLLVQLQNSCVIQFLKKMLEHLINQICLARE